jgi:DNA uptake protein ComE-like DNA-binding protein
MRRFILSSLLLVAAPLWAEEPGATNSIATDAKHPKRGPLVDINSASVDELKTLPGVTDDIAKRIVAGRPYSAKDQLVKHNIVDKGQYAKLRALVQAKK